MKVEPEILSFIAQHSGYTKRLAFAIGRRCEESTIKDVAAEYSLNWKTVKELEKEYMHEKLHSAEEIQPKVIGIHVITNKKSYTSRIIVSDLLNKRIIWYEGADLSEASIDSFYNWLEPQKRQGIRLVLMNLQKAFYNSAKKNIPQAALLYDKFHVITHLNQALDKVRKREYKRLSAIGLDLIKGREYLLLSPRANLNNDGKKNLHTLLLANKRLNAACVLKESFSQLWDYKSEELARKFFENWKESSKWQKLKSFINFAQMIEKHWSNIAAYYLPENKNIPFGYVEELNSKIKVILKRAHGIRDEEYLKLKLMTCTLPKIELK